MRIDIFNIDYLQVVYLNGEWLDYNDIHYGGVISEAAEGLLRQLGAEVNVIYAVRGASKLARKLFCGTMPKTVEEMIAKIGAGDE